MSSEDYVQSIFNNIAGDYDWMNWVISLGLHGWWRKKAVDKLGIKAGETVLDLCCGTGTWTVDLARAVGPEGKVVGIDFSPKMLEIGREKINRLKLYQVELRQGNALDLKFESNSFDYVTIGFGLRNVINIKQVLSEMKRVAKTNGLAASLELSKPVYKGYRKLFFLYVVNVVPWLGKLFTNKYEEYAWLPKSLKDFPESKELENIFKRIGFDQVQTELFAGGAAALHIGKNSN